MRSVFHFEVYCSVCLTVTELQMKWHNYTVVQHLAFLVPKSASADDDTQIYPMVNPLSGVEISGPTVDALWQENAKFDVLCFFSTKAKLSMN